MLEKDQGAFRISPARASGSQLACVTRAPLSWTSPCPSCKEASKRKISSHSRWVGAGKGEEEIHLSALGFFSSSHLTHCGFNPLHPSFQIVPVFEPPRLLLRERAAERTGGALADGQYCGRGGPGIDVYGCQMPRAHSLLTFPPLFPASYPGSVFS